MKLFLILFLLKIFSSNAKPILQEKTSGWCDGGSTITSSAECQQAATALEWKKDGVALDVIAGTSPNWPPGCFFHDNGRAYFNELLGGYSHKKSGTCGRVVQSKEECEEAAVALNWSVTEVGNFVNSWLNYPPGCFRSTSGTLLYNTLTTSTTTCSVDSECACSQPLCSSTVSQKCACSIACQPGTYQDDDVQTTYASQTVVEYNLKKSGKCTDDAVVVQSKEECEKAAVALGWSDAVADPAYTTPAYPPGCFSFIYLGTQTLRYNTLTTSPTSCSSKFNCACSQVKVELLQECTLCAHGKYSTVGASSCDYTDTTCPAGTFASQVEYNLKTSGKCTGEANQRVVQSKEECEQAATALGWKKDGVALDVIAGTSPNWPPGCFFHDNGRAYFNELLGGYSHKKSGTCGWVVQSKEECEEAAVALNWSVTEVGNFVNSWLNYPPGCFRSTSGTLLYNTLTTSTTTCSVDSECACSQPLCSSTVSQKCACSIACQPVHCVHTASTMI